ncbi:MAG: L-threonylcarbamoyladenylate synthase [Bacteroidota bacterium]|jgi:L-threonylcarbamoyladenylate synthase
MKTEISTDVQKAVELLSAGEIVAIPTETVYGLAANALDPDAVSKIFDAKERPHFNPLIIHLSDAGLLNKYVSEIPPKALDLIAKFWPGPLTLVLPKNKVIPDTVTAGKSTVAVRVPAHPVAQALLKRLDFPLAAPSANLFGQISPTLAEHVKKGLDGRICMILDGGKCDQGIESTIVAFDDDGTVVLLRPGSVTVQQLENCAGKIRFRTVNNIDPEAPGMLDRHYAPTTPVFLVEDPVQYFESLKSMKVGLLSFGPMDNLPANIEGLFLSAISDLQEASANLYEHLHLLDSLNCDILLLVKLPDFELGSSLNDRLKRAALSEIELKRHLLI